MIIETALFRNPPLRYRPVAFWFLNHRLEEIELRRQVREMAEKGMGGIMLHARDGLRTAYLKDEWKIALDAAISEAEKHGMEVWLYDENHYPSGTAGDNLQIKAPDRTMKSLKVLREIIAGSNEEVHFGSEKLPGDVMVLAASFDNARAADLSSSVSNGVFNWRVPGEWGKTIVIVLKEVSYTTYPSHKFSTYPDYLDPDLTDEFIALTHQWYHKHFGDKFGKTIRGIFSDNSCGNFGHIRRSVPWGKDMEARFESATGESIRKHIPNLFCSDLPDSERSRLMFWKFFGQTYLDSYFGRIKDYCDKVGLLSTGHLCLEDGLGEHVRQIGDYFDVMRHFSFCAVDHLGPVKRGNPLTSWEYGEHPHATIKNTCSAARFMGLPQVMCESFGCASSPWELDLFETKRIAGWLAAIGINVFVPHGMYYSIAGNRKWECTPDHLHNPMWSYYSEWTDWVSRLSLAGAGGATLAEVAVLYPVHSLRASLELGATKENSSSSDRGKLNDFIESTYRFTVDNLFYRHIDFEIIDEELLAAAELVGNGTLRIHSVNRDFDMLLRVLILPAVTVVQKKTAAILEKFIEGGGMVLFLNAVPEKVFNPENLSVSPTTGILGQLRTPPLMNADKNMMLWEKSVGNNGEARLLQIMPREEDGATGNLLADNILRRCQRNIILQSESGTSLHQVITRAWEKEGQHFYFIFNTTCETIFNAQIKINDAGQLRRISLDTGEVIGWLNDRQYDIPPADGLLLTSGFENEDMLSESSSSNISQADAWRTRERRPSGRLDGDTTSTSSMLLKTMPLPETWEFKTDRMNILPLRQWITEVKGGIQIHRFTFYSETDLSKAVLLMDQERSTPEFDSHSYAYRFSCSLNGKKIDSFAPGVYLDRNIYEAELPGGIRQGENWLEIKTLACLIDWEYRLWPPMIAGDFRLQQLNGKIVLTESESEIKNGDWTTQGYPFFAGEGIYMQMVEIPSVKSGERVILELKNVANACRVEIDGQTVGTRISPPWTLDITPFSGKRVILSVKIINTPNNLFKDTSLPSGLIGPVALSIKN